MRKIFFLLFVSNALYAQVRLELQDAASGKPVDGAQVYFFKNDTQTFFAISDEEGRVVASIEPPVTVEISHVSYQTKKIQLQEPTQTLVLTAAALSLDEVVVTGQYAPQSAKNSVYKVRTISAERLETQGANTLQDVLANELNIRFSRDNALGTSGLSLQGISGQNVKVLIDGVPMTGRSGVANEIDINQINVNTIERIEIVEGPMAVNFGADTLAGVINIITKKGNSEKLAFGLTLQEETVEDRYALFNEGIHNVGLTLGSKINDRFFVQGEARINKFGGWVGDEDQFSDRNRQWYPKTQYFGGGLVRYTAKDLSLHYRLDYLDQTIFNLGRINDLDPNAEPFSEDQEFLTTRWMHQLQAEWQVGRWLLNPVVSYTDYDRTTENFTTFLLSDLENNRAEVQNTYYNTLFFRNTASIGQLNWGSLQLGLETTIDKGAGSTLSNGDKHMEDLAVFTSAEIEIGEKAALRPGIRYSYNSTYQTIPTPSINFKYDMSSVTQLRIGYGRGFRVPSLRELYHEFVDANHNIVGNPALTPEYSHNLNADVTHQFRSAKLQTSLSGFYNQIEDRIAFITPEQSNAATTYRNISEFRSTGISGRATWVYNGIKLSSGATYVGRYQQLNDQQENVPAFVFNLELNTNLSYQISNTNTTFSAFYKFNGPLEDYRLADPDNDGEFSPVLQGMDGFHLLDISINQSLADHLDITFGARNLFNVTAVDNNITVSGAHSGGGGNTSVGYGTSFFLRINYQLKTQ